MTEDVKQQLANWARDFVEKKRVSDTMDHLEAAEIIARMLYDENRKFAFSQEQMAALDFAIRTLRTVAKEKKNKCNQCKYYEGVHNIQGHAPCSFWNLGGVLWNDCCPRFKKDTK